MAEEGFPRELVESLVNLPIISTFICAASQARQVRTNAFFVDEANVHYRAFQTVKRKLLEKDYSHQGKLKDWIQRIVHTTFSEEIRKEKDRSEYFVLLSQLEESSIYSDILSDETGINPRSALEEKESVQAIEECLRTLTQEQRDAILLCTFFPLTYAEAAESLGIPETAMPGRIHRAREKLYKCLRRRGILT